jgi:hypothetical protein
MGFDFFSLAQTAASDYVLGLLQCCSLDISNAGVAGAAIFYDAIETIYSNYFGCFKMGKTSYSASTLLFKLSAMRFTWVPRHSASRYSL